MPQGLPVFNVLHYLAARCALALLFTRSTHMKRELKRQDISARCTRNATVPAVCKNLIKTKSTILDTSGKKPSSFSLCHGSHAPLTRP